MKKALDAQIPLSLTDKEIEALDQIAAHNRRTRSDMSRIIFEDLVDGRLTVDDVPDIVIPRSPAGFRVTKDFKQRFDAFRNGVSADKIMSKALRKLAAQNPQGETNGN